MLLNIIIINHTQTFQRIQYIKFLIAISFCYGLPACFFTREAIIDTIVYDLLQIKRDILTKHSFTE